ncbi:myosin heavy chain, clone 203-like [Diabrotica virgifera virgifera]|uniref:Uncharacterized protein n=1 Tax=Diabrotica virgifera virgifera TaxID=50390 RepID=A0ABM5JVV6_DIAVI|nr:myosin heavy chain, clone 203-like [Diabrotica virgifera virgifera]
MEEFIKDLREKLDRMETRDTRIEQKLDGIQKELKELRNQNQELKRENMLLKQEMSEIRAENKQMKAEIKEVREAMETLSKLKFKEAVPKRLSDLEDRTEREEKKKIEKNVIVRGIKIGEENVKEDLENLLKIKLNVEAKIEQTEIIRPRNSQPFIIAKLENIQDKKKIMEQKKILKGTKIFIDEQRTYEERRIHRQVKKRAEVEKEAGKKVKMGFKKLWIDDQLWEWNNIIKDLKLKCTGNNRENPKN